MKLNKLIMLVVPVMIFSSFTVQAQEVKIGGQLTVVKAQGDLGAELDNQIGFGGGVHFFVEIGNGSAILPRIDFTQIKKSFDGYSEKFTQIGVGADYNFFFKRKANEGLYFLVGLGYASGKVDFSTANAVATNTTYYLQAGLGYSFTQNVGAEIRYQHVKYEFDYQDFSAPSVQAGIIFRF